MSTQINPQLNPLWREVAIAGVAGFNPTFRSLDEFSKEISGEKRLKTETERWDVFIQEILQSYVLGTSSIEDSLNITVICGDERLQEQHIALTSQIHSTFKNSPYSISSSPHLVQALQQAALETVGETNLKKLLILLEGPSNDLSIGVLFLDPEPNSEVTESDTACYLRVDEQGIMPSVKMANSLVELLQGIRQHRQQLAVSAELIGYLGVFTDRDRPNASKFLKAYSRALQLECRSKRSCAVELFNEPTTSTQNRDLFLSLVRACLSMHTGNYLPVFSGSRVASYPIPTNTPLFINRRIKPWRVKSGERFSEHFVIESQTVYSVTLRSGGGLSQKESLKATQKQDSFSTAKNPLDDLSSTEEPVEKIGAESHGSQNWTDPWGQEEEEAYVPPRDAIEQKIADIWANLLRVDRVGIWDDFFQLGGGSLTAIQLSSNVGQAFDLEISPNNLFEEPNVAGLAAKVKKLLGLGENQRSAAEEEPESAGEQNPIPSPLIAMKPSGSRTPFFCVHALLGSAFHYYNLANLMPANQPFYALQAPGIDGEQAPIDNIEQAAVLYINEIRRVQPHGPYKLGGYSYGGWIAFEMARILVRSGEKVAFLGIFGTGVPPSIYNPLLYLQSQHLDPKLENAFGTYVDPIFSFGERLAETEIQGWEQSPLYRVTAAHVKAQYNYFPKPYGGKITVLETIDQQVAYPFDPTRGWQALSVQDVEIYPISGNHLSMLSEPHIQELAKILTNCLNNS